VTVQDAILQTQGKQAGWLNQRSVDYAQTLLLPDETPVAAVTANINARHERFPGVVVLTEWRAIAACALPGIRRFVVCSLGRPVECVESPTAVCYKAMFSDEKNAFYFTIDPDIGEKFSRCIAVLNGEEAAFDAAGAVSGTGILNPNLLRSRQRARSAKEREHAYRVASKERSQRAAQQRVRAAGDDARAVAARLAEELDAKDSK